MADIFISYARNDRSKAQLLAKAFEGRSWSVWWDTRLQAGEIWDEVIERELNAARCVVVLWSKTSVDRQWVRVEANDGLQRRILVPALIEDVRPPLAFRLVQAEPLLDWSGQASHAGLNRLLAAISEHLRTQIHRATGDKPAIHHTLERLPDDLRLLPNLAAFRDLDAPWCPEIVALPVGEFLMGSKYERERSVNEGPQQQVTIGYRFAIGRYPVTFDEYDHFCAAATRAKPWDAGWGRSRRPVINISWWDAAAYCAWLANKMRQPYRLPSEAEWEYACRAGTTSRYAFGDAITPKHANYLQSKLGKTTEVGAYLSNAWGLYDMHGNVWEWVEDVWHDSYKGAPTDGSALTNGEGENSSRLRVIRGGSWYKDPTILRSANRTGSAPDLRDDSLGFRVARTLQRPFLRRQPVRGRGD